MRGRDYTELARLSPQVTKSPERRTLLRGPARPLQQHPDRRDQQQRSLRQRQFRNGTPGWAVGLNAFTPEAVKELQILSAPFDVRYGNFAGGLINAVTRSGSNRVEGSILGYLESTDLSGTDCDRQPGEEFNHKEFGLTFGAPIVRDRVALFVNAACGGSLPQSVPAPTSDTTGGADSAGVGIRLREPGALPGPPAELRRRAGKLLGRVRPAHPPGTSSPRSRRSSA